MDNGKTVIDYIMSRNPLTQNYYNGNLELSLLLVNKTTNRKNTFILTMTQFVVFKLFLEMIIKGFMFCLRNKTQHVLYLLMC